MQSIVDAEERRRRRAGPFAALPIPFEYRLLEKHIAAAIVLRPRVRKIVGLEIDADIPSAASLVAGGLCASAGAHRNVPHVRLDLHPSPTLPYGLRRRGSGGLPLRTTKKAPPVCHWRPGAPILRLRTPSSYALSTRGTPPLSARSSPMFRPRRQGRTDGRVPIENRTSNRGYFAEYVASSGRTSTESLEAAHVSACSIHADTSSGWFAIHCWAASGLLMSPRFRKVFMRLPIC